MTIAVLLAVAAWWMGLFPPLTERDWRPVSTTFAVCGQSSGRAAGCVVDGDSLLIGFGKDRRRIRLTGYDAPELDGACEAESKRAIEARDALAAWLSNAPFQWDGGDEPPRDQYGRELREVSRPDQQGNREYLAETMIARGLASANGWGDVAVDWCE